MFKKIDHIAILVRDTAESLKFYRDQLGLPVLTSQELAEVGVRLTHLDMGNVELQLVEPMSEKHPLFKQLKAGGEGLHHLCWQVEDVAEAMNQLADYGLRSKPGEPHPGTGGKKAAFIDPSGTRGVLWEMTGPGKSPSPANLS